METEQVCDAGGSACLQENGVNLAADEGEGVGMGARALRERGTKGGGVNSLGAGITVLVGNAGTVHVLVFEGKIHELHVIEREADGSERLFVSAQGKGATEVNDSVDVTADGEAFALQVGDRVDAVARKRENDVRCLGPGERSNVCRSRWLCRRLTACCHRAGKNFPACA